MKDLYYHHIWELCLKNEYSKCVLQSDICSRLSKYFYLIADKSESLPDSLNIALCVSLLELYLALE